REMMRLYRDAARQLASGQHLEAILHFVDDARGNQRIGIERIAFQLIQGSQVDDRKLLLENVVEAALGQAAVQRHLAAFETALLAETRAGMLALVAARAGFSVPRTHAA